MKTAVIVASLVIVGSARADEPFVSDEPTAADVASAPLPGTEGGRTDTPEGDSLARDLAQGALVAPKVAVQVAFAPIRLGVWAYDRYRIGDRFVQLFFDDTETYGLYPTFILDSSYGVTAGGRFVHRNVFGEREHLALRAGAGGEFRARADAQLRTGQRFGRLQAELETEFERRPGDAYYGIGNSTEDIPNHHRQELLHATLAADVRVVSALHLRAAGAITDLEYGNSADAVPIDTVYDPSALTGWMGVRNVYGELELRWDGRRGAGFLDEHGVFEAGWLLAAYGGRVHQLEGGASYFRYGLDIQRFFGLGRGTRALATRLHMEGVTGEIEDVAFTQLPQLGGRSMLRGYARDRFRDRTAAMASIEYEWDIGRLLMASLFFDVGRVFPSWLEPDASNIRAGYGMSLQLHSHHRFRSALSVASSVDGGLFIDLTFDPVFDIQPRVEQR